MPKIVSRRSWFSAVGLLLGAGYALLANDGRHHWHEFRHLYSATFYSTAELMRGVFDPGASPVNTPEQVAAWYSTKLFHVYLLKQLVNLFGVGLRSYMLIKGFYAAMLMVAVGLIALALRDLGMPTSRTALLAGLALFSPVGVYLGFKLMPEVPSLLFSSATLTLFAGGVRRSVPRVRVPLRILAGVTLALSALSSWRVPFLFLGFWVALLLTWASRDSRKSIAGVSMVTWLCFLVSMSIGLWLLGGSFGSYFRAITAFLAFTKPLPMWMFAVFNLGLAGMGLWLIVPLARRSADERSFRFFLVWVAVSTIPVLVTSAQFMEPRYLSSGVIPFVGLVTLGLEAVWDHVRTPAWKATAKVGLVGMLGVGIIAGTAVAQNFMPYETDENQLIQAVQSEAPASNSDIILLPWNYTDFHLLRFLFPERPIYLVQSAATESGESVQDPVWTARRVEMYGERYLPDAQALAPLTERGMLYIGWTILPSLQNLHDVLTTLGLHRLAGWLDASGFRNHMTESWLWQHPHFPMHEVARYGQYRVYEVKPNRSSNRPSQPGVIAAPLPAQASPQVPLWGTFEVSLTNTRSYTNPFVETELRATFTAPHGGTYDFFGFYDGDGHGGQAGNMWKLRFMCLESGSWEWVANFTDGAPGASGSFQCVEGALPGPLRVDPDDGRWLTQANGQHFLPRWYYLHELLFVEDGVWQQDVDAHAVPNGYNMVAVLSTHAELHLQNGWNRRPYEQPLYYPWVKDASGVYWDRFDLRSWRKLDRVLQYLRDRGIYAYFFDGFFPNIPPRFPDDALMEQRYLRYALARLGPQWNVTHNAAVEFDEFMSTARLNRIGRYVEGIDPFETLLTVHDTQGYDALVQAESWLDAANLQYSAGTAGSAAVSNPFVLAHSLGKPVLASELVWEGSTKLTADEVRRGAWGILMAAGHVLYGEFDLSGRGVGPLGAGQAHPFLATMWDFMEGIPYWRMAPHNELVNAGSYCLAEPGREYVVYAELGGTITVDLSDVDATFHVEWLNPRTGEYITDVEVTGGAVYDFTNPAGDDNDWVLHIQDTSSNPTVTTIHLPVILRLLKYNLGYADR